MSEKILEAKIRELRQLQQLIEEAEAEAERIKGLLKLQMGEAEELRAGEYKVTYKAVTCSRIDTGALREALPDVAAAFSHDTTTRRLCIC